MPKNEWDQEGGEEWSVIIYMIFCAPQKKRWIWSDKREFLSELFQQIQDKP